MKKEVKKLLLTLEEELLERLNKASKEEKRPRLHIIREALDLRLPPADPAEINTQD